MKKGFSLMELLVVISIIAALVTISAVSYTTVNKRTRDAKRKSDVEQLRNALQMYRSENNSFPSIGGGNFTNASNLSTALVSTYIAVIPADPKTAQTYRYAATGFTNGVYYSYCLSAQLESEDPADTCTPDSVNSHNYGAKNP